MSVHVRYNLALIKREIISSPAFSALTTEVSAYMVSKAKEYAMNGVYGTGSYDTGALVNSIHAINRQGNQHGRWFMLVASAKNYRGEDYAHYQHNGSRAVSNKRMILQGRTRGGWVSGTTIYSRKAIPANPFFYAAARDAAARWGGLLKVGADLQ